jgi:hypothetical protein
MRLTWIFPQHQRPLEVFIRGSVPTNLALTRPVSVLASKWQLASSSEMQGWNMEIWSRDVMRGGARLDVRWILAGGLCTGACLFVRNL